MCGGDILCVEGTDSRVWSYVTYVEGTFTCGMLLHVWRRHSRVGAIHVWRGHSHVGAIHVVEGTFTCGRHSGVSGAIHVWNEPPK